MRNLDIVPLLLDPHLSKIVHTVILYLSLRFKHGHIEGRDSKGGTLGLEDLNLRLQLMLLVVRDLGTVPLYLHTFFLFFVHRPILLLGLFLEVGDIKGGYAIRKSLRLDHDQVFGVSGVTAHIPKMLL